MEAWIVLCNLHLYGIFKLPQIPFKRMEDKEVYLGRTIINDFFLPTRQIELGGCQLSTDRWMLHQDMG